MMRRSSSSSSIPVAVRKSRSIARTSTSGSQREHSLDALGSTRKTFGFMHRSRSQSHLNVRTPLVNASRASLKTPLASGSRKSPLLSSAKKEKRPVNDKKWQLDNFHKVQNFLLEDPVFVDAEVRHQLKPMTTTLFVNIMNFLFKKIDERIEITTANYKEAVVSNLKTFGYPDNVSVSLMKTVNASHSWPQVLAIFAWLVDLILYLRTYKADFFTLTENEHKCAETFRLLMDYSFIRFNHSYYSQDSKEINDSLKENLCEVFEVYENESPLDSVENLRKNHAEYVESLKNKEHTVKSLEEEIALLQKQIEEEEKEKQEFIDLYSQETEKYQEEFNINEKRKLALMEENKRLKEIIKTQEFSLNDKLKFENERKDLQYTLSLKKEEEENLQTMNQELDFRVTEVKRTLEKHISELNKEIRKVSVILPELNELFIRESGYNRSDFKEILENVLKRNEEFKAKYMHDIKVNKKAFDDLVEKINETEKHLTKLTEDVFTLKQTEKKKQTEINQLKAKHDREIEQLKKEKNEIAAKIEDLKRACPNVYDYEEKIKIKEQEKLALRNTLKLREAKAVEFFEKLTKQILQNKNNIMAIKYRITEAMVTTFEDVLKCHEVLDIKMNNFVSKEDD